MYVSSAYSMDGFQTVIWYHRPDVLRAECYAGSIQISKELLIAQEQPGNGLPELGMSAAQLKIAGITKTIAAKIISEKLMRSPSGRRDVKVTIAGTANGSKVAWMCQDTLDRTFGITP